MLKAMTQDEMTPEAMRHVRAYANVLQHIGDLQVRLAAVSGALSQWLMTDYDNTGYEEEMNGLIDEMRDIRPDHDMTAFLAALKERRRLEELLRQHGLSELVRR